LCYRKVGEIITDDFDSHILKRIQNVILSKAKNLFVNEQMLSAKGGMFLYHCVQHDSD
jgi:hypothetical protein